MSEKHNIRQLMVRLMEELGLVLTPANQRLIGYKVTDNGNRAVLKGWGWVLSLELRGSCHFHEGAGSFLTDPEVDWKLKINSRCSFEDLSRLQQAVELLGVA